MHRALSVSACTTSGTRKEITLSSCTVHFEFHPVAPEKKSLTENKSLIPHAPCTFSFSLHHWRHQKINHFIFMHRALSVSPCGTRK